MAKCSFPIPATLPAHYITLSLLSLLFDAERKGRNPPFCKFPLNFVAKIMTKLPSKSFVLKSTVFESREELCHPQYVATFRQYHEGH